MKMIILPVDSYIRTHKSQRVTNPQVMVGKQPTIDGLLSPDIFGRTPDEKRVLTGYIELNKRYISPMVYSSYFRRRMRDIDNIISAKNYYIKTADGDMVPTENSDAEGAGTGLQWLYDNYIGMKIKGSDKKDTDSILTAGIKKSMNRLNRNEVFTNKVVVIPLIYRDINTEVKGMIKLDELNAIYQKILSLDKLIRDNNNIALVDVNALDLKMQSALVELYDYFVKKIFGKDGIQRRYVMGRKSDYAARSIISAPNFKGAFGSHPLGLSRAGYPLSVISDTYILIMLYHMEALLRHYADMGYFEGCTAIDVENYFTNDRMTELINNYSESWGERLDKVSLKREDGSVVNLKIPVTLANNEEILREITITEFLYIIAYPNIEMQDHFMMISRYPIMDDKNIAIIRVHVLSTIETEKVIIDGLAYPYYPKFSIMDSVHEIEDVNEFSGKVSLLFHETVKMSNTYLKGFDADYDGDKMAIRPIFSISARKEAAMKLNDPMGMFSLNGSLIKFVGDEAVQCLYSFSIDPKDNAKDVDNDLVDIIINKDPSTFDPTFIFKDCGMAKLKSGRKYYHYDKVIVPKGFMGLKSNTESTLGRLIVNKIIFSLIPDLEYINKPMNKSTVITTFEKIRNMFLYKKITMEQLERCLIVYEDFGFRMASFIIPSFDISTMVPTKAFKDKRDSLLNQHKEELDKNNIYVAKDIENEMIKFAKNEYKDYDCMEWYNSAASGKMSYGGDFKVSNIFVGTMPVSLGGGFNVSTSNYIDGMKPEEMHLAASQLLLGAFNRAKKTAVGGYYAKQAIQIFESLRALVYGSDCKTKDGISSLIDSPNDYMGRFTVDGVEITTDNISEYLGKVVMLRSPIMCDAPDLCSRCVGTMPYELLNSYDKAITIGLFINKFFTELTQKALKKSHDISAKLKEVGDLNDYFMEED